MTNPDYTHYLLVIDRSGSMESTKEDAQGGIRQFVRDQAALPGRATLTLVQFDNEHETVYDFARLHEARDYTLVPRGMTRLLDAVGFAITRTGERLANMSEGERPGKVIVVIVTDGQENDSREYTLGEVKGKVTEQTDRYGWAFTYLGSALTTFKDAASIGVPEASTLNYSSSRRGTDNAYAVASASAASYASGQSASVTYDSDQRKLAAEEDE